MQHASESFSQTGDAERRSDAEALAVDGTFWTIELPHHWIVEVAGRLWAVPAVCGGWSAREPYDGPRERLRPYSHRTAKIIHRLLSQ